MPALIGNLIAILLLAALLFVCTKNVVEMIRGELSGKGCSGCGGGCSGNCSGCSCTSCGSKMTDNKKGKVS